MQAVEPIKIDIVKIQMIKDGTIEYGKMPITNPQALAELGLKFLKNADREMFILICLNTKNFVNCIHLVSIGTLDRAIVTPREILKTALLSNAASIAFVHNHPSGDPEPSEEDLRITRRLIDAGKIVGIELLDHIIIGNGGGFHSFKERGLI